MTFETLLYIHTLLRQDVEAKGAAAREAARKWKETYTGLNDEPDPLENRRSETRIALDKARAALHEFETKEWN